MDGAAATDSPQPACSSPSQQLDTVKQALDATLNPRVPNDIRLQALRHLEQLKTQRDAPQHGFALANDGTQNDMVRYYGLQLLEYAVRYRWHEYDEAQTVQLREWVRSLAGGLGEQDALFIRNKVAQLWVEVSKRCWGDEWMDMDQMLVELWERPMSEKGTANKLFVLSVLETLSEDIVNSEDSVAGLRLEILGACLNEIVIPHGVYVEYAQTRGGRQEVRCGEPGWLARLCAFFSDCVKEARMGGQPALVRSMSLCAVKALNALKPTMNWITLKAAVEANCIDCMFMPFHTDDAALQTAAIETLYALLCRPYNAHWHEAWSTLHQQALRPDRIAMIRHTYERTASAPGEDEEKYTLQKKMADVLSVLADAIAQHHVDLAHGNKLDLPAFYSLLLAVLQSQSLVVSIPVLHSWSKTMAVTDASIIDIVTQALGTLIQTCGARLLRYESLPADEDEITQFLDQDFDTVPERHAFLGNYRRYCVSIIQSIARTRPLDALQHVLEQMRNMLQTGPYTSGRGFDASKYSKSSLPVLQFDAQFNVVSSALKGFTLWCHDIEALSPEEEIHIKAENDRAVGEQALQEWCYGIIDVHVDDPEVAAQVLQTLVLILRAVRRSTTFVLRVVQHLLTMRLYNDPSHQTFSDAVKAFEAMRVVELQKLALAFTPELLEVYHELQPRIEVLAQKHSDDPRLAWGYRAFLLIIVHRAPGLSLKTRMERLQQMLEPVYKAWADPGLSASVQSLHSFCEALGLGDIAEFYKAYRFDQVQDWSAQQLDGAGQVRQKQIREAGDRVPLRMTKSLLAATTEKLPAGSAEFESACALWSDVIPVILPALLQMLRHAQAFHNMANWSQLPDELQAVVRRTLQDRFWQAGISNESKEEFYQRISGSKTSYEGFASVVRGTMREIREQGYHIIYLMTKFGDRFYGLSDLAQPLAEVLFADAGSLPSNHLHPIINLTTGLVQRCPPVYRGSFLPPLLTQMFTTLDAKISSEWAAIGAAYERKTGEDDELSDEMRTESVLRQLTYSMVSFVPFLLEFDRQQSPPSTDGAPAPQQTLGDMVLSDPVVLEPMIMFCTHALRMRDTRCCVTICKVFRSIVPLFQSDVAPAPQVREFMGTEVLKACITSLNEPYFADVQKDLAALIAQIISLYSSLTDTPKGVLQSLPNMPATKVDKAISRITRTQNERLQRALVLEVLEGVRGVSIYEAGKIAREAPKAKKTGVQAQYMEVEQRPTITREDDSGLEGVAGLFAGA